MCLIDILIVILIVILLFIGFTVDVIKENMFWFVFCGILGIIIGICRIVAKNDKRRERERELKEKTKDP